MTPTTEQNIIEQDGWIIDTETGEVLGHVGAKEEFHVTDRAGADWVLERMSECDGDITGLRARLAAVQERIETQIKERTNRREWLEKRFGPELEAVAREYLEGQKSRTLKLTYGDLSFRTAPGSIKVTDMQTAVIWAQTHCKEAIKVTTSVLVTPLKGRESELPPDAFEVTAPAERFYVKTGVKP